MAQKSMYCLPLLQHTVEDAYVCIYVWYRPHLYTTVTKSHVVLSSLTFQSGDELHEQERGQPEVSSVKRCIRNIKISNWIWSAICNH